MCVWGGGKDWGRKNNMIMREDQAVGMRSRGSHVGAAERCNLASRSVSCMLKKHTGLTMPCRASPLPPAPPHTHTHTLPTPAWRR